MSMPSRRIGVIDVGSNSVRLVVFNGPPGHPAQMFNEKVMCGLGRDVGKSGSMDADAMERAYETLARFAALMPAMGVTDVLAVATAAVREAENGGQFVSNVQERYGLPITAISGEEEARLSALGVIGGLPAADGIVGDLGGGSLELVSVRHGQMDHRVSLPIGPVRLIGRYGLDKHRHDKEIARVLDAVDWLKAGKKRHFYVVGGAWRAIGRIQMAHAQWPLPILHGFSRSAADAIGTCELIGQQHPESLRAIPGVPGRRVEALPTAARILKAVLDRLGASHLVYSSYGLREGLVFDRLGAEFLKTDPFLAECAALADRAGRYHGHGDALMAWLTPFFEALGDETGPANRLRHAACLLSDAAWRDHPDYRAEQAAKRLLHGRFVGVDHQERAYVAMALYHAHGGPSEGPLIHMANQLLDEQLALRARILGLAIRLGRRLSGGVPDLLKDTALTVHPNRLDLNLPAQAAPLAGEVVSRRLAKLAAALDRDHRLIIDGQIAA